MTKLLYVPGFKELDNERMPGSQMKTISEGNDIDYSKVVLPGDPEYYSHGTKFSLTQTQERLKSILSSMPLVNEGEDLFVASYCLTAPATIGAVNKYSDRVKGLILIRPVFDSVHAVRIMDGLFHTDIQNLKDRSEYLDPSNTSVFDTLIKGWDGDATEFVNDLIEADAGRNLEEPEVDSLKLECPYDMLANPSTEEMMSKLGGGKAAMMKVMGSHTPKIIGTEDEKRIIDFMKK